MIGSKRATNSSLGAGASAPATGSNGSAYEKQAHASGVGVTNPMPQSALWPARWCRSRLGSTSAKFDRSTLLLSDHESLAVYDRSVNLIDEFVEQEYYAFLVSEHD